MTRQLSAYHREFKEGTELAALEHTEKRYSWLMSWLRAYDQVFSQVFPPGWRVNEYLTEEFCFQTRFFFFPAINHNVYWQLKIVFNREKLIETMEATRQTLNVSALKRALKKTIMFEQELMKWFSRQSVWIRLTLLLFDSLLKIGNWTAGTSKKRWGNTDISRNDAV